MSVAVALDELRRRVDEFGPLAFLVTTGPEAGAHVVSVGVSFDGEHLRLPAGRTSSANVERTGTATLLWPGPGGPYSLIVDGQASCEDGAVVVRPTRAVLHRLADAPDELPSCVTI